MHVLAPDFDSGSFAIVALNIEEHVRLSARFINDLYLYRFSNRS